MYGRPGGEKSDNRSFFLGPPSLCLSFPFVTRDTWLDLQPSLIRFKLRNTVRVYVAGIKE